MEMPLLEKLCLTAGVPGREHRVRDLILGELEGLADEVSVDPMGSIIAVKRATKTPQAGGDDPTKVMLACHMDQIGFLVRAIDDKGFLRVHNVGGFDTRNLFARMVKVCPDVGDPSKDLTGVLNPGTKPVHIATEEERKKIPEVRELAIDLCLPVDEVKGKVKIGDMVTLVAPYAELNGHIVSQCLDNRVACWIGVEALRKLTAVEHAAEVHCVFTVQEEVGLRGALTSAYTVKPDIGIGVDTTLAVDTPGTPDVDQVTRLGMGAGITVMDSASIGDLGLVEQMDRIASDRGIPAQRSLLGRGGTDTGSIQRSGHGARTMTLSCPTRYIHTVTEMVHRHDLEACRDLIAAFIEEV
jgi:endoglucanase